MYKSLVYLGLPLLLMIATCPDNVVAQRTSNFDPDRICSMIRNGTMIKDPRACNTWIQCVDGKPETGVCAEGLFYDRKTFACVPPDNVTCLSTSPCATVLNPAGVFVADPYSCEGYFYCNGATMVQGACNDGRFFNPETRLCSATYVCVDKMDPESYCNIVPDGVFIGMTDTCTDYQMCWDQVIVNNTCPHPLNFDPFNGVCDYAFNVNCPSDTPDVETHAKCEEANVFISDEHTCNGYFYCMANEGSPSEFIMMPGTCPDGWFFDGVDGGVCVPRTRIECKFNRCAGMGFKQIQLANEWNDGCHGFTICQNGENIGNGTCPDGQYFDEVIQLCTTNVIEYIACALVAPTEAAITGAAATKTNIEATAIVPKLGALTFMNVPEV